MTEPSDTDWRYGVYLFALPPLLTILSRESMWTFISITSAGSFSNDDALLAIAAAAVSAWAGWAAVLLALVVAVSVVIDAGVLAEREWWSPNRWLLGVVGVVHLVGAQFLPLSLLSTPVLCYYVYRRRQHVP